MIQKIPPPIHPTAKIIPLSIKNFKSRRLPKIENDNASISRIGATAITPPIEIQFINFLFLDIAATTGTPKRRNTKYPYAIKNNRISLNNKHDNNDITTAGAIALAKINLNHLFCFNNIYLRASHRSCPTPHEWSKNSISCREWAITPSRIFHPSSRPIKNNITLNPAGVQHMPRHGGICNRLLT